MEKDCENEVYVANGEIRVLIIARILSCFVIFGLLLGVIPMPVSIILVSLMWFVNFSVGGSIIFERNCLVCLHVDKSQKMITIFSEMLLSAFIWGYFAYWLNFWLLLVLSLLAILTVAWTNLDHNMKYVDLYGRGINVAVELANGRFINLAIVPMFVIFGSVFGVSFKLLYVMIIAVILYYIHNRILIEVTRL
ncbi:MAG: hypothetical protein HXL12_01170 [Candidatus Nanosynbacter sp.]|nr:hypothetical protein [Candidatus Nanosynbacter sp.]